MYIRQHKISGVIRYACRASLASSHSFYNSSISPVFLKTIYIYMAYILPYGHMQNNCAYAIWPALKEIFIRCLSHPEGKERKKKHSATIFFSVTRSKPGYFPLFIPVVFLAGTNNIFLTFRSSHARYRKL